MPDRDSVKARIDDIEAEMKKIRMWHEEPPPPEAFGFRRAFAMDTMTFSQWLQFIFIPRVRQIVESGGPFPGNSSVGAQAIREFDGYPNAERLCTLLSQFDDLIEHGR